MRATILSSILEHDLHRSKKGSQAVPYMIHVPVLPDFYPIVVSTSRGKRMDTNFVAVHKMSGDGTARVGVFEQDSDKIDEVINDMIECAYQLSLLQKWNNIFDSANSASSYIIENSDREDQPHACLIPNNWSRDIIQSWFQSELEERKLPFDVFDDDSDGVVISRTRLLYKGSCRIVECNVSFPVFLSKPDLVGLYTQFLNNQSAIILHNIQHGIAFVPA